MTNFTDDYTLLHYLHKFAFKIKEMFREHVITLCTGLLIFFVPIQGLIVSVGLAIVLDTFTGLYKTIKKSGWKSIESRKLSNIVSKMILYQMAILFLYPIDKFLLNELILSLVSIQFFATKLSCVLLILVEITSIKENIEEALDMNIWKVLKQALKRAKDISNDVNNIHNPNQE